MPLGVVGGGQGWVIQWTLHLQWPHCFSTTLKAVGTLLQLFFKLYNYGELILQTLGHFALLKLESICHESMSSKSIGNVRWVVELDHCQYFPIMCLSLQYILYTKICATARLFLWVPAGPGTRGVPAHQEALERESLRVDSLRSCPQNVMTCTWRKGVR